MKTTSLLLFGFLVGWMYARTATVDEPDAVLCPQIAKQRDELVIANAVKEGELAECTHTLRTALDGSDQLRAEMHQLMDQVRAQCLGKSE
jgi:hypothetical protein